MNRLLGAWALFVAALAALSVAACGGGEDRLIVGATTSLDDTGILQELVDAFEDESGYDVTPVIAGTGQILALGKRGEVDVTLTHSPADEAAFVSEGYGVESQPVMENLFVVVGPEDDPARVSGAVSPADALARIAATEALFVSRGDLSGTNQRELAIWEEAGVDPAGESWYLESAVSQGQSLLFANERQAYTLVDSATFGVFEDDIDLVRFLVDAIPNRYSVTLVNPELDDEVNEEAARAFFEYVTSDPAREVIASFIREGDTEPLFFPAGEGQ
jgi:tungstate transport system substrate-binding protein